MLKWKYEQFMPFYAPDSGADGGAGASGGEGADRTGTPDTTDYKALYEKAIADSKKLKASFDQASHDIAELKKAQKAKMSDDELKAQQDAEKEQAHIAVLKELAEMKAANLFAKNGFDEKDYGDIAAKIVEVGGDKASELAESIIAFVQKSNKSAVANAQRSGLKDGAHYPQTSTAKTETHTYAQMATQSNQPSNREQEIKDFYKKK